MKNNKPALKPTLNVEHKDDPELLYYLMKIILLAYELSGIKDREKIEEMQKNFLDFN